MKEQLELLVYTILNLPDAKRTREDVIVCKRKWAKEHGKENVPTNLQVLKTYYSMVTFGKSNENDWIEWLLKKRAIRSQSGIVAVQVLTKPFRCPGKCIFCPNDATMPKSYINTQPGAMRALLNHFDPYKQVYNRLLSLTLTGHRTDKIEMIVLWWTRDVYPTSYKKEFIKWLYDACNTFTEFLDHIEIDFTSDKSARYTVTEWMNIPYPETVEESVLLNETAPKRIIWLTIETRPEYVTDENCQLRRGLWVTRVEMWIQTLHNNVHEANVRGHDNQAIRRAMHKLRQYGFKISNHYMPGLYTSTPEMDEETFRIAFSTPRIKSDELKFYPTAVIPNTPLYDLFKSGEYEPIKDDDLKHLVRTFKTNIIPPYSRIKRLARDFDTNEVVAGANTPNLRQLVMNEMTKEFAEDEVKREKQYKRLHSWEKRLVILEKDQNREETSQDFLISCRDIWEFLSYMETPLWIQNDSYTSLSWETRKIDERMETYTIWGLLDTHSERNFVCLCTRCREYRNIATKGRKKKDKREKKKDAQDIQPNIQTNAIASDNSKVISDLPFIVVRRYRSSNGEEMFVSFEDKLWYLYGFVRLLLPDEWMAIDYTWIEEGKALVREVHVYGSLKSLIVDPAEKKSSSSAQHRWFGSQLMDIAEQIAHIRWYIALSVISWVGVRWFYRKIGYSLEGTYMVKELKI